MQKASGNGVSWVAMGGWKGLVVNNMHYRRPASGEYKVSCLSTELPSQLKNYTSSNTR